jgi:hypothetical protein
MFELFELHYTKSELARAPEKDRLFYLMATGLANDLQTLMKLFAIAVCCEQCSHQPAERRGHMIEKAGLASDERCPNDLQDFGFGFSHCGLSWNAHSRLPAAALLLLLPLPQDRVAGLHALSFIAIFKVSNAVPVGDD